MMTPLQFIVWFIAMTSGVVAMHLGHAPDWAYGLALVVAACTYWVDTRINAAILRKIHCQEAVEDRLMHLLPS